MIKAIKITLTPELLKWMDEQIEIWGKYATHSELIRDALRHLKEQSQDA